MRVLVVEDDVRMTAALRRGLRRVGARPRGGGHGRGREELVRMQR